MGLGARGGDRFGTYSLGMKQRLGIAAALLKDPDLLILDEPTNGIDPAGMAEMRTFIRELAGGHRTVLLSSHLMAEVEQVCDRVGVISHGGWSARGRSTSCAAASACGCGPSRSTRPRACSPCWSRSTP